MIGALIESMAKMGFLGSGNFSSRHHYHRVMTCVRFVCVKLYAHKKDFHLVPMVDGVILCLLFVDVLI